MTSTRLPIAVLLGSAAALGGCAIVQSTPSSSAAAPVGMTYLLPKALLPVELVETSAGALMLRVKAGELVGDPKQRYFLHAPPNAFSSDDVKIEVDPVTGLLKQVTATSEDQSLASLKDLISAARGIRRAEAASEGDTVLYAGLFDPDGDVDPDAATRNARTLAALNSALQAHVSQWQVDCTPVGNPAKHDTTKCDDGKLRSVNRLLPAGVNTVAGITLNASPLQSAVAAATRDAGGATAQAQPVADCSVGLCHRAVQPFQIDLAIPGVFAQSAVVLLPNQGQVVALPLDRAAFVKTEHTVILNNGIVQSHHAKRPSSATQLVKWPLEVYEAIITTTSKLIQLRIGANDKDVAKAQSELETAKELKRIADELEALKLKKGVELAPLGGIAQGGQLVQVLGSRQSSSNTGKTPDVGGVGTTKVPPLTETPQPCQPGQAGQPGQPCQPAK